MIQKDFSAERIFEETKKILNSKELRAKMKSQFREIKDILGDKIAPQNAALELERLIIK